MTRWLALIALISAMVGCGSDDTAGGGSGAKGGVGGGAASAGTGAAGGSGGSSASAGSGGIGATAGTGGAGAASGGSAGSGASPGLCGAIPTFADGLAPTEELHVAVDGNDSNTGSASSPFATIGKAAQLATLGTAIRIHAGSYAGGTYLSDLAGSANAPIWIGGAPGETPPVIDGGGEALHFTRVRYLIVHDLEARNTSQNGINIDDGGDTANVDATRYVIFQRVDVHDVGGTGNEDCLKMSGVNDYFVVDSTFARCGGSMSGSGIDHVGCHNGVIARSSFSELSGNAVQAKGGSENIEIKWNLMQNAGERAVNLGGSTGDQFFRPPLSTSAPNYEAKNIHVVANVIVGATASLAFVGCVDCLAANNTLVDPTNWILRILQETVTHSGYTFLPAQNGRFVNNLVYFNRGDLSTTINIGPGADEASFQFQTNLWYAHDDPAQSAPSGLPSAETGAVVGQDPALADPAGGNYQIASTSPAAGKGTSVAGLTGDVDGTCYAAPPSIGAYEVK